MVAQNAGFGCVIKEVWTNYGTSQDVTYLNVHVCLPQCQNLRVIGDDVLIMVV
jgi:hypothetical protein